MLLQIQAKQAGAASLEDALRAGDSQDAVDLLLGCHRRIRHFTSLAVALCQAAAPPGQMAAAAAAVYRYYHQALPLHEADENLSVYPRLRAAAPPQALAEANQAMLDQHMEIDRIVARLLPQWRAMAEGDAAVAAASAADAGHLQAAWDEHLELEERLVFPALRTWLGAPDREAIRREMAERRRIAIDQSNPSSV